MIIGNGQLAQVFMDSEHGEVCIFASGVSDSNCVDSKQFDREKSLLLDTLERTSGKKFVYFSSCALSASEYMRNEYYNHKENMENMIKKYSNNYYIFRIPQLFGNLILHKTLINFIYKTIEQNHKFNVYSEAYRYVIEISDVKKLVEDYISFEDSCITIDLANPYRYKVLEIVEILENLLGKKADYSLVQKRDGYMLEFKEMTTFIKAHNLEMNFSKDYLLNKLQNKI